MQLKHNTDVIGTLKDFGLSNLSRIAYEQAIIPRQKYFKPIFDSLRPDDRIKINYGADYYLSEDRPITNLDLTNCNFSFISFHRNQFESVSISNSVLRSLIFSSTELKYFTITGCTIAQSKFSGIKHHNYEFSNNHFQSTNFINFNADTTYNFKNNKFTNCGFFNMGLNDIALADTDNVLNCIFASTQIPRDVEEKLKANNIMDEQELFVQLNLFLLNPNNQTLKITKYNFANALFIAYQANLGSETLDVIANAFPIFANYLEEKERIYESYKTIPALHAESRFANLYKLVQGTYNHLHMAEREYLFEIFGKTELNSIVSSILEDTMQQPQKFKRLAQLLRVPGFINYLGVDNDIFKRVGKFFEKPATVDFREVFYYDPQNDTTSAYTSFGDIDELSEAFKNKYIDLKNFPDANYKFFEDRKQRNMFIYKILLASTVSNEILDTKIAEQIPQFFANNIPPKNDNALPDSIVALYPSRNSSASYLSSDGNKR